MLPFKKRPDYELPPKQRGYGYVGGTYIVYRNGEWRAYVNRWKSNHPLASCIRAPTIRELSARIHKAPAKFSFRPKGES